MKIKLSLLTLIIIILTFSTAISAEPCDCFPGDVDEDGACTIGDAVYLINHIFRHGPEPTPYLTCSGDPNGDCSCNVGDVRYIIEYVFKMLEIVTCEEWVANCGEIR